MREEEGSEGKEKANKRALWGFELLRGVALVPA